MNTYRFAALPSNGVIASAVTLLVSAWFLVAAGSMILDDPEQATRAGLAEAAAAEPAPVVYAAPAVSIAPEARLIIVVDGKRA